MCRLAWEGRSGKTVPVSFLGLFLNHCFCLCHACPCFRSKLRGALGLGPRLRVVLIQPSGAQLAKIGSLLEKRAIHPPRISRAFPLDRAG